MPKGFPNCTCKLWCGDVPENKDDPRAVCKGLGIDKRPTPLVHSSREDRHA